MCWVSDVTANLVSGTTDDEFVLVHKQTKRFWRTANVRKRLGGRAEPRPAAAGREVQCCGLKLERLRTNLPENGKKNENMIKSFSQRLLRFSRHSERRVVNQKPKVRQSSETFSNWQENTQTCNVFQGNELLMSRSMLENMQKTQIQLFQKSCNTILKLRHKPTPPLYTWNQLEALPRTGLSRWFIPG